jgi:hypothetical protein
MASQYTPASAMRPAWDGSIDGGTCVLGSSLNINPTVGDTVCKPL